ncbi:MAG TPA: carbon storage regulator [Gemmataceae bacterium]|nr:carbon storage regulator [Gemmataceae bacterium]
MLVLSRRTGDELVIGGQIRITITAVKGDRVRLGVLAPPEVRVDREEVHRRRKDWTEPRPDRPLDQ